MRKKRFYPAAKRLARNLPILARDSLTEMAAEATESTPQRAVKVLIADDKVAGRELVKMVLENDVYEVFEARDGIEAIDMAHLLLPELIILDLHMPGVDGFGVIRELRQHPGLATTPMLALTASAMRGDQQRALEAGFTGYITKPVSPKELRAEVSRLLA